MKKKLLFVITNLDAGGAEKSLVNLLNTIDYADYDVDLILFQKKGIFLPLLPKEVVVLEMNSDCQWFSKGLLVSCFHFLVQFKFKLFFNRILGALRHKMEKNKVIAEQESWRYFSKSIKFVTKEYDAAIGFLEKSSIYFTVDKVKATTKIGWIHTTYSNSGMSADFDINYFQQLNFIVGVSPECVLDLKHCFPSLQNKMKLIYNIISPDLISKLSLVDLSDPLMHFQPLLLTIARLSSEKGIDLALDAAVILKQKAVSFTWIVIGDGPERLSLESKIKSQGMESYFQLVGLKQNPYPYMAACTVYVQPSRYEGKSMAIEEAKILRKPIVVTDFSSSKDQIVDSETGVIAAINAPSLAEKLENLLNNPAQQNYLALNLSRQNFGTAAEIEQLYDLLNG